MKTYTLLTLSEARLIARGRSQTMSIKTADKLAERGLITIERKLPGKNGQPVVIYSPTSKGIETLEFARRIIEEGESYQ